MPKLSIITINLNNKEGLQKTMASVLNQTFTDYEYIVIDGGSNDGSVELIKEHADKITYWISEVDKGIYNAMNKGIVNATGEFALFLNSGDFFYNSEVLSNMLYEGSELADVLYGDLARTFPDGTKDIVKMPHTITSTFLYEASLAHPVTFIRRTLFQKYGLYDESYQIAADHAFFVKIFLTGNVVQKHKKIVVSNFAMNGVSASPNSQLQILEERKRALNVIQPEYLRTIEELNVLSKTNKRLRIDKFINLLKLIRQIIHRITISVHNFFRNYSIYKLINPYKIDYRNIPIIINNRNRITHLKKLIESLEKRGYRNIQIIDNNSDYPPLLDFYNTTHYTVHKLGKNTGYCALWNSGLFDKLFKNEFYVYTDSDMELTDDCPDDFMDFMLFNFWRHQKIDKIGLSLKIDDLPDHYNKKMYVVEFESRYWKTKYDQNLFLADVDTTFALYRPGKYGPAGLIKGFRLKPPFSIRHLPWYENSNQPDDEDEYYRSHSETSTHWTNY